MSNTSVSVMCLICVPVQYTGNDLPVSVVVVTADPIVGVRRWYAVVTVLGSAVVASEGKALALVDTAPACNLVSLIDVNDPPDPETASVLVGVCA